MAMDGDPDISLPTDVIHDFHVTFDPDTRKFVGLPASWMSQLNSDNTLSISNEIPSAILDERNIHKSSGRRDPKDEKLVISPPLNVKHVVHLRLDSKTGEITGTHRAWVNLYNSSNIPESHLNGHREAMLDELCCHNAFAKRKETKPQLPTNINSPIPLDMPSTTFSKRIQATNRIDHQLENSPIYHASGLPYCPPLTMSIPAAGNMRSDIDHTEAVYILKQLAILAESVGIIRSPTVCGTGFRIGLNYVMTAKHVVDEIMKAAPVLLTQTIQPSEELCLKNADVFIEFAHERNGQQDDGNHRFYFEPDIVYSNDHLDTVILKLRPDNKICPRPLTNFSRLSEQMSHGYFIGHPGADIKKTDRFKRVTMTPGAANAAKIWSLSQAGEDGFLGIDDPHRVLLHCSFGKGASGAPGFWICPNDGRAYVVLMLVRGYPDWYYDERHSAAMKVGVPANHLIEQGIPMGAIHDDIRNKAHHLWEEIFCFV